MSASDFRLFDGFRIALDEGSLVLRRLSRGHTASLIRFNAGLSSETKRLFSPHAYDPRTVADYARRSEDGVDLSYVAEDEAGEVVAYFFLWEVRSEAPLLGIGVADAYQNRGLGKELMRVLIESAKRLGRRGIDLTTMPDNERAFRLYLKCGFRYVGDVPNLTGDGRQVTERRLFLPLVEGTLPPQRDFGPPDQVDH